MESKRRKDGSMRYRELVYMNGRAVKSPFFQRKSDAKEWKRNKLLERDKMKVMGINYVPDITLQEYSKIFITNSSTLAKRTIDSYQNALTQHILPELGRFKLNQIRTQNAETLKLNLLNLELSDRRVNNILKVLKIVLNHAVRAEYLIKSPLNNFKLIKEKEKPLNYWLPSECDKFLTVNRGSPYYPLFLIGLNTGMRKGELCGLCWDAIDFTNRLITIKRTVDRYGLKETTKSKKPRVINMNEPVYKMLSDLARSKRCLKFVFTRPNGLPLDYKHLTYRVFSKAIQDAGVKKIKFHDLRTTFGCNFCMNGGDIFTLSQILGHSSVAITQKSYAHLTHNFVRNQMEKFSIEPNNIPHLTLDKNDCENFALSSIG